MSVSRSDSADNHTVRVGVLGYGTVGAELVGQLTARSNAIAARTGITLCVTRVAVRDTNKKRPGLSRHQLMATPAEVVGADDVDLVVELMGGLEPARSAILASLAAGKPVVTGNKELLASHGPQLFAAADRAGVDLLFEAAVGGGIPLIRPLRESLVGEAITRLLGIVNGTTNFILTRMSESGADFHEALAEAQLLGFAEADPTADVGGHDAASKAAILASIAFGARVTGKDVSREGIEGITPNDVAFAARLHHVIKLLAVAEEINGALSVRVYPAMLPTTHPLAAVRESYNAVVVEGSSVGRLMFYGRGAGGAPTASAVLGDVIDAAVNLRKGTHASLGTLIRLPKRAADELTSAFYLNIEVTDQPGVLAAVANTFGHHAVSIRSMEQEGLGADARIIFITHEARETSMAACLRQLRRLGAVKRVVSVLRVVEDH